MEPGICYIKNEYLVSDLKVPAGDDHDSNECKRKPDECDTETTNGGGVDGEKFQKLQNGKKDRKRGQNKNRPVYKEDRFMHLCHSLVDGPTNSKCTFQNCRYVHDLQKYLDSKGDDLGKECPIFKDKGYCARGVTCRFAQSHLDSNGNNIRAPHCDENMPLSTFNGITTELQVRLRKRDYDFTISKQLLAKLDKMREDANNYKNGESNSDVTEEIKTQGVSPMHIDKPLGCAIDNGEEIKGRDVVQKPAVDFTNKLLLSPLTTVGNLPFRRICKEFGADITCGEMACVVPLIKGLGQEWALTKRHETENVFGVQLCGNNPNIFAQTVQILSETTKVDFIDLNIGCPIDLIYQQGGGSALMRRPNILELVVRSCSSLSPQLPLTVKMRTGVYAEKSVAHDLMPLVEEWGATAVTLHGRSREQRYTKSSNWQYIEECASKVKRIPVIGNGDIFSYEDYNEKKLLAPHVSSVMIGRGALIKPWIFKEIKEQKTWDPSSGERFEILQKFTNYGLEHWGSDTKGVETTRRFLLEWLSFLYRYVPFDLLTHPPQKINQRPQKYRGRDEMETLMSSSRSEDWVKISEMLLCPVPPGFTFLPKHRANAF